MTERAAPCAIMATVGFNPFRPARRRPTDYLMVAAAMLIVVLLLAWAFTG